MDMNYVYNFGEESIPLWVKTLYWVLYIIPFLFLWVNVIYNKKKEFPKKITTVFFIFYFTMFAVFYCINSDYFAYRDWIYGRDFTFWAKEQIYVVLVYFCRLLPTDYPYEFFRLIVWGIAILFVYLSARLNGGKTNPGLAVFFLFVLFCGAFNYARASLAMSVYFAGLCSLLYVRGKLKKALAISLTISSFFFHHEMIVGIGLLPCLFIPFENKKSKMLLLVIFVIGVAVVSYLVSNPAIFDSFMEGDDMSTKIEGFNDREQGAFRISTFINYFKYYFLLMLFATYFRKNEQIHKYITGLYRITCGIIMIATVFFIVAGSRSSYTYRVLYMSMIPLSIMLSYFYFYGYVKRPHLILILILAFLSNSVRFINSF